MLVSGRVSKNKTSHLVKIKINKINSFEEKLFIYLGLKDFENIFLMFLRLNPDPGWQILCQIPGPN